MLNAQSTKLTSITSTLPSTRGCGVSIYQNRASFPFVARGNRSDVTYRGRSMKDQIRKVERIGMKELLYLYAIEQVGHQQGYVVLRAYRIGK